MKKRKMITKSLEDFNKRVKGILGKIKQEGYNGYSINDHEILGKDKKIIEELVMYLKKLISDSISVFYNLLSGELYVIGQEYVTANAILYHLRTKEFGK